MIGISICTDTFKKVPLFHCAQLVSATGGVTDDCAVCKILHVIECAWGSSGFKLPTV